MAMRELKPWNRGRELSAPFSAAFNPLMNMRQEMDRLFDDTFRGFALAPLGLEERIFEGATAWPSIEITETAKQMKVMAELPGLDEKDVEVKLADGMLCICGEKKEGTEDQERRFSERFYGRFERRIALEGVDENKISATFKNGVLTVTLEKMPTAASKVKQIPIKH
jgi:HSP20 family protein